MIQPAYSYARDPLYDYVTVDRGDRPARNSPRDRFGWRWWLISDEEKPGLVPPFRNQYVLDSPIVRANCLHGNDVPSDHCPCGVHYVKGFTNFFLTVDFQSRPEFPDSWAQYWHAYTFGAAIGRTAVDLNPEENWVGRPRRCAEYRILGIVVMPDAHSCADWFETRYRVPVVLGSRDNIETVGQQIISRLDKETLLWVQQQLAE